MMEPQDSAAVLFSLSLTRAAAVSQAVQGHATNGDDAVRVSVRARRTLVALRW